MLDFISYLSYQSPIIVEREVIDDSAHPFLDTTAESGDELLSDRGSPVDQDFVDAGNDQESGDVEGLLTGESCVPFLFVFFSSTTKPCLFQRH